MAPQLAVGGCTPRPRKLRDASLMMALGIPSVEVTMRVETQLGRRCLVMMRQLDPPERMQDWMYSDPLRRMTSPRTRRAVVVHMRSPRAT